MKDEGKKWAKGKYPSTSAGLMRRLLRRINAEIPNHRGNSTVPCFQHQVCRTLHFLQSQHHRLTYRHHGITHNVRLDFPVNKGASGHFTRLLALPFIASAVNFVTRSILVTDSQSVSADSLRS